MQRYKVYIRQCRPVIVELDDDEVYDEPELFVQALDASEWDGEFELLEEPGTNGGEGA